MQDFNLGILTGISYVSGLDYYKGINEKVLAESPKRHLMPPNPSIVMVSVDCDEYAHYLTIPDLEQTSAYLLKGVDKLVAAGCNLVVIASNTGHICVPAIEAAYPDLNLLHIADCVAYKLKQNGFKTVGLVGTKETMEGNHIHQRLAQHGISTVVPTAGPVRDEIFRIIYEELSFNEFKDESRRYMIDAMLDLRNQGAEACISGCTEIELLVQRKHMPEMAFFPSADIHIQTIADLLLGKMALDKVLPA